MIYKVLLHPKAKTFLGKLDQEVRKRTKYKLEELERFPNKRGKHLKYSTFWSLRVGGRIIYEIDERQRRVMVLFIEHRKNVYDDHSRVF